MARALLILLLVILIAAVLLPGAVEADTCLIGEIPPSYQCLPALPRVFFPLVLGGVHG